jgi:microcin C transport system substrate-binding protein
MSLFRPLAVLLALAVPASAQEVIRAHGISPFGELKYPEGFAHFDYVNPDAPKGGTISFRGTLASQTFDSLNPFILKGEPAQGLARIYDTLLVPSRDEAGAYYGLVAESIEYPPERSWVIFHLRPEARFADGHPVTAEDVVFSLNVLREKGEPYYAITLEGIDTVEALDEHTVKVTFKSGIATRDLISEVGSQEVIPKHYYDTHVFEDSTLEPPLGSGPFLIDRVEPGRTIRYCKNPDYWGKDLNVRVGQNNFDCVVYEYFADTTAAFEALKSGQYLLHEEFSSASWGTAYDFPARDRGWVVREEIPDGRPSGAQGFYFNLRREKFQDVRVREAIALMFNFEWSNATLFYGSYKRSDSFFENSSLEATGMPEGAELALLEGFRGQVPDTVFTEPAYSPPESGPDQMDRRMLRRASALLDEAGWTVGDDGMRRNAAGEVLSLAILDDSPAFTRIIVPYVDNLRALGIDARHELVDPAQMEQRQEDFDYDMTPGRIVLSLAPSVELRTVLGSQGASSQGTLNLSGIADPAVDALIERVIAAENRAEMETAVHALDRVLRAKHIWVENWGKGTHWLAYWDVFGRPELKPLYDRGDDFWWLDQAKYDRLKAEGAPIP